jgi:hypothetical protein
MYFPKQFKGIFDFGYQRKGLEIPTFYFVYLIGSIMISAVIGTIISSITRSDTIRITYSLDVVIASIVFLVVSHTIIKKKGLGNDIKIIWLLPLVSAALTLYVGHILGVLVPTILSARPNKHLQTGAQPQNEEKKEATEETIDPE